MMWRTRIAARRHPECAGRLDELAALQRKGLPAHDARGGEPARPRPVRSAAPRDCRAAAALVRMMTMNRYGSEYSTSTKRIISSSVRPAGKAGHRAQADADRQAHERLRAR